MCLIAIVGIALLLSVVPTQADSEKVAFTAGFKTDQAVGGAQIVKYNEVFTNLGSGYDSSTGIFTAPEDGLYVFNINGLTTQSNDFWTDLYLNDKYLISVFARIKGDFAYGGNSIVLLIVKNDRVYIKTRRTAYFFGRTDQVYATFSGYKIGSLNSKAGNVAFTAGFTADQTIDCNQIIAYTDVFTNHGDAYNSSSGVFTATKGGMYVFTISGLTMQYKDFWIDLYKNDQYLLSAYAKQASDYAFGGNSIVLRLKKSDKIYVKTRRTAYFYGRTNDVYAIFSGYLIGKFTSEVGNVAFTSVIKDNQTLSANQIIAYNEVFTNHAGGYSKNTGTFTVPKDGVYVFSINAVTQDSKEFWLDLYKNDQYFISAYARLNGDRASGGNSIVLELKQGDRVYVKARRTVYLFGATNEIYASFTGYLIRSSLNQKG